jgi:L-asparaginase / beta-aspartyl-peptidase
LTNPAIIVHGGAGNWPRVWQPAGLKGVGEAATKGFQILRDGGTALYAVEGAINIMENNPLFNAGRGATLNLMGEVEADAGIMDGRSHRGAGVALLRRVKNPISLARIVLDETDHALLAGKNAEKLAEVFDLPKADLKDPARVRQWKQATRRLGKHDLGRFPRNLKLIQRKGRDFLGDTVGALAIDRHGDLAAGDSTGGVFLKLPGRIGDSPILGAGLYADNATGAATATGLGEIAMRLVVSKATCDAMTTLNAQHAAERTVNNATKTVGKGLGIIALDRRGRLGVAHNTQHLCWASYDVNKGLVSRIHR